MFKSISKKFLISKYVGNILILSVSRLIKNNPHFARVSDSAVCSNKYFAFARLSAIILQYPASTKYLFFSKKVLQFFIFPDKNFFLTVHNQLS